MIARNYYRREFWKNLSFKSYSKFLLAVFFTFASLGFVSDLFEQGSTSNENLIFTVIFSGFLGVAYAFSATRNWKLIIVFLVLHLTVAMLIPDTVATISADLTQRGISKERLIIDGFGILMMIVMGYAFFVIFITGEGIPHVRMKTEIELARQMQSVLVPDIHFNNNQFEIIGHTESYYEIGGDLIDVYPFEKSLVSYTADVTGHGVGASLLMGMFKSAMHTSLQKETSLSDTINTCNQALQPLKKASTFLTTAAVKFMQSGKMEFCVAGHLPVLHFQAKSKSIMYHKQKQIPLAVKSDYTFLTDQAAYQAGDILLFLSDGITELTDKKGREYGLKAIEQIIIEKQEQSLPEIYKAVRNDIKNFASQKDD